MSKARDAYRLEVDQITNEVEEKAQKRFPEYDVYTEESCDSFETKVIVIRGVNLDDDRFDEIEDALAEFCCQMDEECEYLTFIPRIRGKRCL